MLKGCQREMILLQTKESEMFECAYFVLRRGKQGSEGGDMMAEAHRILGEGGGVSPRRRVRVRWLWFLLGWLLGAGVFALSCLIIP